VVNLVGLGKAFLAQVWSISVKYEASGKRNEDLLDTNIFLAVLNEEEGKLQKKFFWMFIMGNIWAYNN
jgi:hypothetical protein